MQDARSVPFIGVVLLAITTLISVPAFAQVDFSAVGHAASRRFGRARPRGRTGRLHRIPLNDAARLRADSWDAALYGCLVAVPTACLIRHVAERPPCQIWKDVELITGETIAIHVSAPGPHRARDLMDGRPHPPEDAAHAWAGFSHGNVGRRHADGHDHAIQGIHHSPRRRPHQRSVDDDRTLASSR